MNYYDNVIVSIGDSLSPNIPEDPPGFEKFEGRLIHANDFKNEEEFEG